MQMTCRERLCRGALVDSAGGWCTAHRGRTAHWPQVVRWEASQICREILQVQATAARDSAGQEQLEMFVVRAERALRVFDQMFGINDPQQPVARAGRAAFGLEPSFAPLRDLLSVVADDGNDDGQGSDGERAEQQCSVLVSGPMYALMALGVYNDAVFAGDLLGQVEFRMLHVDGVIVSVELSFDDDEVVVLVDGLPRRTFLPPRSLPAADAELYARLRAEYTAEQAAELVSQLGT